MRQNLKLLVLKVIEKTGIGDYSYLIRAIYYAIKWVDPNGESINIINLSIGGTKNDPVLHNAIKEAVKNNILIVCTAGNLGDGNILTTEKLFPGFYEEVIQVGAVSQSREPALFSNTNNQIDFLAPGIEVFSTFPTNSYKTLSGASMAVPHISGAAALIMNIINSSWSSTDIISELIKHSKSLGCPKSLEGNGFFQFRK